MLRMQCSGYNQIFRYEILKSAYNAYENIKEKERREGIPMYRNKDYRRNERRKERLIKMKNWYKKGNYEAVMFIPATPNSVLKKEMQTYVNNSGTKVKITERSGTKIGNLLQRNEPFKAVECNNDKCLVCNTSKSGKCRSSGVIYQISCDQECPYTYHGQTSSNACTRGLKHTEDLCKKREKPLWKHSVNIHNKEKRNFEMKVIKQCRNDATKRQIMEAIVIRNTNPEFTMNERSEWNEVRIPRIEIDK